MIDGGCQLERQTIDYLRAIQEKGVQYGVFVADSKYVTHDLVASMNALESRIPFVSRCPSNFEGNWKNVVY